VDARSWLTTILGQGLANGVSLEEMVRWLFPQKESRKRQKFGFQRIPERVHQNSIDGSYSESAIFLGLGLIDLLWCYSACISLSFSKKCNPGPTRHHCHRSQPRHRPRYC
jgi:hypothetical protein